MGFQAEIAALLQEGVITNETADKLRQYYAAKGDSHTNRLFVIFGILGAFLVGLGIILILAHNWDQLSKTIKTFIAFLPLLVGQILCGYTLIRKQESVTWRESSATFLILAIGASISLISQIYNIPGNMSSFLLTWLLLSLPLAYLMKSSFASLLYIVGITYYGCETGYWSKSSQQQFFYWPLLLSVMPYYYLLLTQKPNRNFTTFHNWIVPISITIVLGTIANQVAELMFISYCSLFASFYLLSKTKFFSQQRFLQNGYSIIGLMGTIILLLILSFDWFWKELRNESFVFEEVFTSIEFLVSATLTILASVLLIRHVRGKNIFQVNPISYTFILFIAIFIIGLFSSLSIFIINLFVLVVGVFTIRKGARRNHIGVLNFGLLIITALIICRFFDTDITFLLRGILFISVGVGFFLANYWMLKKRKLNA